MPYLHPFPGSLAEAVDGRHGKVERQDGKEQEQREDHDNPLIGRERPASAAQVVFDPLPESLYSLLCHNLIFLMYVNRGSPESRISP